MTKKLIQIISASLLFSQFANAQLLTASNVNITITNGTQLTVKGDLLNGVNSSISNNGTIDISGNFTNNSGNDCYGASAGTVILNGANQAIAGSSVTTFNNLTLAGSGIKSMLTDVKTGGNYVSPSGILALNDRQLILNSNTLTVTNPSPTAIASTTGFIQSETDPSSGYGIIRWETGPAFPGSNFVFPFGNAATGDYLPLTVSVTTSGSGNGSISAATYPTNAFANPNNRPLPTGLTALTDISGLENAAKVIDRWWMMQANDFSTPPLTNLTFTYRDSEWNTGTNTITENQLVAQRHNGTNWDWPPSGINNSVNNTVTTGAANGFSGTWTLVENNSPLPVSLISFTAKLNPSRKTDVEWMTASEVNNDYFTVERSADGKHFENIGIVDGAGNSTQLLKYYLLDENPLTGISFYRLKQTDFDGKFTYSQIVSISNFNVTNGAFTLFPNPAKQFINIYWSNFSEDDLEESVYKAELMDISGKVMKSVEVSGLEQQMDVSQIPAGIYFIRIIPAASGNDSKMFLQRVVVMH